MYLKNRKRDKFSQILTQWLCVGKIKSNKCEPLILAWLLLVAHISELLFCSLLVPGLCPVWPVCEPCQLEHRRCMSSSGRSLLLKVDDLRSVVKCLAASMVESRLAHGANRSGTNNVELSPVGDYRRGERTMLRLDSTRHLCLLPQLY